MDVLHFVLSQEETRLLAFIAGFSISVVVSSFLALVMR